GSRRGRTTRRTRTAARRRSSASPVCPPGSAGASRARRTAPTCFSTCACRQVLDMVRGLKERFPDYGLEGEVYVTAPGAEIAEDHPLVAALDESHGEVFGSPPERDVTRWFSDASVLSRYGIATVNYGTSSGLPDAELGENLDIDGLVRTAEVYARVAQKVCGSTA